MQNTERYTSGPHDQAGTLLVWTTRAKDRGARNSGQRTAGQRFEIVETGCSWRVPAGSRPASVSLSGPFTWRPGEYLSTLIAIRRRSSSLVFAGGVEIYGATYAEQRIDD